MSLKPFHIILISAAIALGIGMGFWGINRYPETGQMIDLYTSLGGFVIAGLLVAYLAWFLSKMKKKGW